MSDHTDRQQQQDCTMTDFVSLPPWGDFVNDIDWEDSINWEYWARAYDEARDGSAACVTPCFTPCVTHPAPAGQHYSHRTIDDVLDQSAFFPLVARSPGVCHTTMVGTMKQSHSHEGQAAGVHRSDPGINPVVEVAGSGSLLAEDATVESQAFPSALTLAPRLGKSGDPENGFVNPSPASRHPKRHGRLVCPYADCTHDKPFPRKYELNRHVATKHDRGTRFLCPVLGCEKLQQPRPFIRSDKLTAHLKLCHRVLALFACPYEQCAGGLLGRDLMYVHLVKAHTADHSHSSKTARAMTNAIATDKPFCPRWECRKSLPLGKFEPHVLAHGKEDLLAMGDDLLALNYLVVIDGDSDLAEGSVVEPHQDPASRDRMTLKVLCPVCKSILDSREAFRNHFAQHHVVAAEHEEHFIAWRETAKAFDRWSPYEQFVPYKPWSLWSDFHIRCTYCNHAVHPVRINIAIGKVQHHMSMLADPEQLRPYRMQILKLLPEFIRHPIWDDLGKPLQQFHDGGLANA